MRRPSPLPAGFTLVEVCLALAIALVMMAAALPGVTAALGRREAPEAFNALDAMAREAHARSVAEGRDYVIVWDRAGIVRMRPESPVNRAEAEGLRQWKIASGATLALHLPAALTPNGMPPDAIWTFWADGFCEPAEIRFQGSAGKWTASYDPLTVQAEVRDE
ncbi:MAG: prepilin-type N-terminal cleavage/methylation domain-containing protein [Verrucomicrobiota bacterium]